MARSWGGNPSLALYKFVAYVFVRSRLVTFGTVAAVSFWIIEKPRGASSPRTPTIRRFPFGWFDSYLVA
jgi:hypothetical protein